MIVLKEMPGRNNHNAAKLIEKYNNLAGEAISGGDKILSESYFQHADHFKDFKRARKLKKIDFKKSLNNNSNTEN